MRRDGRGESEGLYQTEKEAEDSGMRDEREEVCKQRIKCEKMTSLVHITLLWKDFHGCKMLVM